MKKSLYIFLGFLLLEVFSFAQRRRGGGEGGYISEVIKTAREVASHSTGTPDWTNPKGFEKDVFTFARLRYEGGFGRGGGGSGWTTDTPDSDLNLSYRLQQMTSMKVDPNGRYLSITDPEL